MKRGGLVEDVERDYTATNPQKRGMVTPKINYRTPTWLAISVLGLHVKEMKLCMSMLTHAYDLWRPTATEAVSQFTAQLVSVLRGSLALLRAC